jgi:hypothetical protein
MRCKAGDRSEQGDRPCFTLDIILNLPSELSIENRYRFLKMNDARSELASLGILSYPAQGSFTHDRMPGVIDQACI